MGRWWPTSESEALSAAVCPWDLLKEVTIIFITCTIVWPQVKQQGGTQPHPSTENWIKDLLSMVPPIRTRLFPPQSISPIRKLPLRSYPYSSEDRQNENHNHRKLTKLITWTIALSNSMKRQQDVLEKWLIARVGTECTRCTQNIWPEGKE